VEQDNKYKEVLISEFQCPGCVGGPSPDSCSKFDFYELGSYFGCNSHVPGTFAMGARSGLMCLGLPRGFCRVSGHKAKTEPQIRIHSQETFKAYEETLWNKFNIAVWAMEKDGFLFVRTFMPRIDVTVVDVVEGGTLDMVPGAVNVGEFMDEID